MRCYNSIWRPCDLYCQVLLECLARDERCPTLMVGMCGWWAAPLAWLQQSWSHSAGLLSPGPSVVPFLHQLLRVSL